LREFYAKAERSRCRKVDELEKRIQVTVGLELAGVGRPRTDRMPAQPPPWVTSKGGSAVDRGIRLLRLTRRS